VRLLESGRAKKRPDGVAVIRERDHVFAGMALMVSDKVAPHGAYHRFRNVEGDG
jgi:hypothetical protein